MIGLMEVSGAGLALLAASVVLILAEVLLPTGGFVGALGLAVFVAAGLALEIPVPAIVAIVLVVAAIGLFVGDKVFRAQRQDRVMTGWEELIGSVGEVRVALNPIGQVFVEGALWTARAPEGGAPVAKGAKVKITRVEGLTLVVEPLGSGGPEAGVESPS